MTDYSALLTSIATHIADYRAGEIETRSPAHVHRWIEQFSVDVRVPILMELNHVFSRVYLAKHEVEGFLRGLAAAHNFATTDPRSFWAKSVLLGIQTDGSSQTEMLAVLRSIVEADLGVSPPSNAEPESDTFIYLDDGLFSGRRIKKDISQWLPRAPAVATLHIVVVVSHTYGEYYAKREIELQAKEHGKALTVRIWRSACLEDRKHFTSKSDVLRPTAIPDDSLVRQYVGEMELAGRAPVLRTGTACGSGPLRHGANVFSSPAGRELLEREFLIAGARIREMCPNLHNVMRPLGFHGLTTLGFGTLFSTYRNCPNNCPLALWVGKPWIPLLPRRTNEESKVSQFHRRLGWQ